MIADLIFLLKHFGDSSSSFLISVIRVYSVVSFLRFPNPRASA